MQRLAGLNGNHGRRCDAKERAKGERRQWHANHGRHQVDEPVGEDGRHAQKQHVVEEIRLVLLNLRTPLLRALRKEALDQPPARHLGQQVAQRRPERRAEADERQCDGKVEQEAAQDG